MCLYFSTGCRFTNLGSRQARFVARTRSPRPPGSSRLRASSLALHPPCCTPQPRAKKFVHRVRAREESAPAKCRPDQRGARQQGDKINIEIPARLTGLLQRELQPENNSTYSVLACLPLPYVFLFTNDSNKLNVFMNYSGGPNVVTCEQCMLSSCLNPQCNVCSFVVLQCPSYLMVPI